MVNQRREQDLHSETSPFSFKMSIKILEKQSLASLEGLSSTAASFNFIRDQPRYAHERPYQFFGRLPPEHESMRSNVVFDKHTVGVHEVR